MDDFNDVNEGMPLSKDVIIPNHHERPDSSQVNERIF
jgi:hypothetical protein